MKTVQAVSGVSWDTLAQMPDGAGFPIRSRCCPLGHQAHGRATMVAAPCCAQVPRSPPSLPRGGAGGFSCPAPACASRCTQHWAAAGPPLWRGAAGSSLTAVAGLWRPRATGLPTRAPEFARARLLHEPRACGRGRVPAQPLPDALSSSRSLAGGPPLVPPLPPLSASLRRARARRPVSGDHHVSATAPTSQLPWPHRWPVSASGDRAPVPLAKRGGGERGPWGTPWSECGWQPHAGSGSCQCGVRQAPASRACSGRRKEAEEQR